MKRVLKIVVVLLLLGFIGSACSQYVCPAYSINSETTAASEVEPG